MEEMKYLTIMVKLLQTSIEKWQHSNETVFTIHIEKSTQHGGGLIE